MGESRWLDKVLSGSRWFAGPRGDDPEALGTLFGHRFSQLHGARFGLAVANGSVAIEVALRALGISPGDEVVVPAYTFVSTATSVLMVGAIPVFADIQPHTYCLDPSDVQRRIGQNTRAIIVVHLGGHMADMPAIQDLAKRNDLLVIEDCAQAIGASLNERKAGTWGRVGTFSFQSNKTITAGEGGLLVTDDPELSEKIAAFRAFGRSTGSSAERSSAVASTWLSSNYRLSEFLAAVLLAQLERFPSQDDRRQANAAYLTKALDEIPGVRHIRDRTMNMKHGYYYYLVGYEGDPFGNVSPEALCRALNAEGIPFVPGDQEPIYRHPVFDAVNLSKSLCPHLLDRYRRSADRTRSGCPTAEDACKRTILLRHQVLLGEREDMDHIIEALWKIHDNIGELL
jgi:dTDP-4-amino-4,6-dideoxygalactose transaminase